MKKKCRVYNSKKLLRAKDGLNVPAMTQDSQPDPVWQEKASAFMAKIQQYDQAAKEQQALEQMLANGPQYSPEEFNYGGNAIPGYAVGGGYGEYGQKKIANIDAFGEAAVPMNIMDELQILGQGAAQGAGNRAKAKQPLNGETYDESAKPGIETPDGIPDSGFGSKQPDTFGQNTDQSFGQGQPMQLDSSFNEPLPEFNPALYAYGGNLPQAQDGVSYPGQDWFLDEIDEIDTETFDNPKVRQQLTDTRIGMYDEGLASGTIPTFRDAGKQERTDKADIRSQPFAGMTQKEEGISEDDYTTAPEQQMKEFEPGGPDDPRNEGKKEKKPGSGILGDMRGKKGASKMIAGMKVGTKIGEMFSGKEAKRKAEFRRKQSDPFEKFNVAGSDRGDYMANIPGMGEALRPDEHTLMGYNTKIAQEGIEINSELEASQEEIDRLIAQGYDIEFLD